jgi:hypothetical protein
MNAAATIARIALWIMIGAVVLSFFVRSRWITITWVTAAVVCLICMLIVAASKRR